MSWEKRNIKGDPKRDEGSLVLRKCCCVLSDRLSKKYMQTNQYKKCRSQWRLDWTDGADTHPAVSLCAYLQNETRQSGQTVKLLTYIVLRLAYPHPLILPTVLQRTSPLLLPPHLQVLHGVPVLLKEDPSISSSEVEIDPDLPHEWSATECQLKDPH